MAVRTIEIKENVFANNDAMSLEIEERLRRQKTLFINVMSGPGSGKTTTLVSLINRLKGTLRIGEMDVDIESDHDARKVSELTGIESLQINNGGLCHIDADMVSRALDTYNTDNLDLLILENIGNLVCPAEFKTGAHLSMMILSVPEGDDKPLKYPLMFQVSDIVLINKIDTVDYFNFDFAKAEERIKHLNPNAVIFKISAKTGAGMDDLAEYIRNKVKEIKK